MIHKTLGFNKDSLIGKPIGGDFSLNWNDFVLERPETTFFSTGRSALAAILMNECRSGDWLVPEYICPVVPKTIKKCGGHPKPYPLKTPWMPDLLALERLVDDAVGIIVPFYMGMSPPIELWSLLANRSLIIIEDRCQCVAPTPSPKDLIGNYAIGSFRKWMPTPDGAYCVKREGVAPRPLGQQNMDMVQLRLAAALLKQIAFLELPVGVKRNIETAFVELFQRGEKMNNSPVLSQPASWISHQLIRNANFDKICSIRISNQMWLAKCIEHKNEVQILEPEFGSIQKLTKPLLALPIVCDSREVVYNRFKKSNIFCAIHWIDGDWCGRGGLASVWEKRVLSIPIDQRLNKSELQRIVDLLD